MSQFINESPEYCSENSSEIDFDAAELLDGDGSTCEIYRTRWQRHSVFVKRLKEVYRSAPVYLDALDKEYEIGVRLKHEALPTYLHFHRDYIVLEYIDGKSLAEMIKTKDPWLAKEQNVVRVLRELAGVVGYLHRNNVVHCDIKPDNILITNNTRNLVLVDFDKCYSDSLDQTSGNPAKFGLSIDEAGHTSLDFRGIAKVAETIKASFPNLKLKGFSQFIKACKQEDANIDKLIEILAKNNHQRNLIVPGVLIIVVLLSVGAFMFLTKPKQQREQPEKIEVVIPNSPADFAPSEAAVEEQNVETQNIETQTPEPVSQETLLEEAAKKAAFLDQRIRPYFEELTEDLDTIAVMQQDVNISPEQLLEKWQALVDKEEEYKCEAYEILKDMYPDISSERELWRILSQSKVISSYNNHYKKVIKVKG